MNKNSQTAQNSPALSELDEDSLLRLLQTLAPQAPEPQPLQLQLAQFGKKLFFDPKLSEDAKVSCASCHIPENFFADGLKTQNLRSPLKRNTPTIINSVYMDWQFWDGRADSLISQARGPLESEHEQFSNWSHLLKIIREHYQINYQINFGKIPELKTFDDGLLPPKAKIQYPDNILAFAIKTIQNSSTQKELIFEAQRQKSTPVDILKKKFSSSVTHKNSQSHVQNFLKLPINDQNAYKNFIHNLLLAIAAYESTLIAIDSPFDQFATNFIKSKNLQNSFVGGYGTQEHAGLNLFFGKAKCVTCHHGPMFSDQSFHNLGLSQTDPFDTQELGRAAAVLELKSNFSNCLSKTHSWLPTASCEELEYLKIDAIENVGAYRTPSLRNLKQTAPYFHDGSAHTLMDVIEFYDQLPLPRQSIGERSGALFKLNLSQEEKKQLQAFLIALSSPWKELGSEVEINDL